MNQVSSASPIVPLLSTLAVARQTGESIPGQYCTINQMWMVEVDGEHRPLIGMASGLAEVVTKTKVEQESDDSASYAASLELATKTLTVTEQDDVSAWASGLAALLTKTEVNHEQDKQDVDAFGTALLEVSTKTSTDVERDDQAVRLPGLLEPTPLH